MRVITFEDIKKINELYAKIGTYAGVARETGFSPATVKKYVNKDYVPVEEKNVVRFNRPLPEFDSAPFRCDDWGPLCVLNNDEKNEIKELWKELDV